VARASTNLTLYEPRDAGAVDWETRAARLRAVRTPM